MKKYLLRFPGARQLLAGGVLALVAAFATAQESAEPKTTKPADAKARDENQDRKENQGRKEAEENQNRTQQENENRTQQNQARPNQPNPDRGAARNPNQRDPNRGERGERERRQRGYALGFDMQAQGDQLRVNRIDESSAAAQAGLRQNDRIVSIDSRPFTRPHQVQAYLGAQFGRQVPMIIERDGKQYTVQLNPPAVADDSAWLGVFLEQGDADNQGARITHVYPAGPAARAGLQTGDIITRIADQKIEDSGDLVFTVQGMEPQARVDFAVLRGDQEVKVPVTLGTRNSFVYRSENREPMDDRREQGFSERNDYDDVPVYAMQLEHDRRNAEQHQRIEDEIRLLREEIAKLREELKRK